MTTSNAPILDIDPFSIEFLKNPYPYYEQLRETGPVVFLPQYKTYAMVGFDEVYAVLDDWKTFSSGFGGTGLRNFRHEEPELFPQNIVLEVDPPEHTDMRDILGKVLAKSSFAALRDEFQIVADGIVDDLIQKEVVDGVEDIANAFHLKAFGDAVGLEAEGRENLIGLTNSAFNEFGATNALVEESRTELMGPVSWALSQSLPATLTPNGFGAQIHDQVDEGRITEDQAGIIIRSILTGSYNTIHSISGIVHSFAEFPDQWEILKGQDCNYAVRSQAFDEVIRFRSPLQTYFRTTTADTEIAGIKIPYDSKIQLFLGAANRDPQRWENPNRFDIQRDQYQHVAFGHGPHSCVGEQIARLEADAVLESLIKRVQRIILAGKPVYRLNNMLRGLSNLPIRLNKPRGNPQRNIKKKEGYAINNNLSKDQKNIELLQLALQELIVNSNAKTVGDYWAADYIQHNPLVPNGNAVLKRFFTTMRPKDLHYEHGLCMAEGDFVALHSTVEGFLGKPPQVLLDIFKISDGKIAEHWDLLQDFVPAEKSVNGNAMFPIVGDDTISSTSAENKNIVETALARLFVDLDLSAVHKYWAQDYIQHNPTLPNGRDTLTNFVSGLGEDFNFELGFAMAWGEFVLTHSRYTGLGDQPIIGGDIFRLDDGTIVEHWDVLQEEVPANKSVNGNAMFPIV